jgi:hypothetical protein
MLRSCHDPVVQKPPAGTRRSNRAAAALPRGTYNMDIPAKDAFETFRHKPAGATAAVVTAAAARQVPAKAAAKAAAKATPKAAAKPARRRLRCNADGGGAAKVGGGSGSRSSTWVADDSDGESESEQARHALPFCGQACHGTGVSAWKAGVAQTRRKLCEARAWT